MAAQSYPLLIEPNEWAELEAGLIQRAELLEAVLADAYGPATLTAEGRLPAAMIAGNPEFLRPLVGIAPPGGAHLRFYAVDVGRGADGRCGSLTIAPRRHPVPAMPWRFVSLYLVPFLTSIA